VRMRGRFELPNGVERHGQRHLTSGTTHMYDTVISIGGRWHQRAPSRPGAHKQHERISVRRWHRGIPPLTTIADTAVTSPVCPSGHLGRHGCALTPDSPHVRPPASASKPSHQGEVDGRGREPNRYPSNAYNAARCSGGQVVPFARSETVSVVAVVSPVRLAPMTYAPTRFAPARFAPGPMR